MRRFIGISRGFAGFIILAGLCGVCVGLESPIRNPTVPQSSLRSGLHKSPNPINIRGNLVITGNVAGLKYFHGPVPYKSVSAFGTPLGSGRLRSFLRFTAPINSSATNRLSPQPYYQPSTTVASIHRLGFNSGLASPSIRRNKGTGEFVAPSIQKIESKPDNLLPGQTQIYDYSIARPLSFTPSDLERMVNYSAETEQDKNRTEISKALNRAVNRKDFTSDRQQDEKDRKIPSRLENILTPASPAERTLQQEIAPARSIDNKQTNPKKVFGYTSVYKEMLAELKPSGTTASQQTALSSGIAASRQKVLLSGHQAQKMQLQTTEEQASKQKEPYEKVGDLRSTISGISARTSAATVGIHKSFATESHDKFNSCMRIAENLLSKGDYYRAVDAYTLASIYKPKDPLAYAGRAHALFASGEYMSSAYFLIKAINIFPGYVKFKIDLNAMIPDKDKLDSRIADVRDWIKKTDSGELSFLLAYIYYQFGMNDSAVQAINFAARKFPNEPAVKTLALAIKKQAGSG